MYYYSHLVASSFKIFIRLLRSPFTWLVRVVVHAFQVSCSPMFLYKHKCYFSFFFFYGVNNEKMHTPNQCFFLPNLLFHSNIPLTFPYRLLLVWILPAASERPPCSLFLIPQWHVPRSLFACPCKRRHMSSNHHHIYFCWWHPTTPISSRYTPCPKRRRGMMALVALDWTNHSSTCSYFTVRRVLLSCRQ